VQVAVAPPLSVTLQNNLQDLNTSPRMSRSSAHARGSAVVVLAFIDRLSFTYSGSSYDFQ
jgi:hypothetical protein